MKRRLDVELEVTTDLSPLELASKIAPLVREALEAVRQSLGVEGKPRSTERHRATRATSVACADKAMQ